MITRHVTEMTTAEIADAIGIPFENWAKQCHAISLAIVKAGLVPGGRVARGTCHGVGGQHSWIVDGRDCYSIDAKIIDPTLWSYVPTVHGIWIGTYSSIHQHRPHGHGIIWAWGKPADTRPGERIKFDRTGLSKTACGFLDLVEPLNQSGWMMLFSNAPVGGWPAGEIIDAACEQGMEWMIPVDRVGMLTERNPAGGYE